jgi:hypothetical protein
LGLGIFLFTTVSRTALGPTQPPIQWVPGALSLGVKWPGREADHSPPSSAKVRECVEIYLHSPNTPSWSGAELKLDVKVKVKLSLRFNWAPLHEGRLGSGRIAPRIIDLGTRLRWVVSFTIRPLYPQGKTPWYPLDRRLGGHQSRSGRGGEERNSQLLPVLEPPIIRPYLSAIPLSYPGNELELIKLYL